MKPTGEARGLSNVQLDRARARSLEFHQHDPLEEFCELFFEVSHYESGGYVIQSLCHCLEPLNGSMTQFRITQISR